MPVYNDVAPFDYYPYPESKVNGPKGIFKNLRRSSILDVGAGHGGVFDIHFWDSEAIVTRKEACDLFWIRPMPEGWVTKLGVDVCKLDEHYAAGEFDFVQCCEVLEHVADTRKALEQLVRVAKKAVFITSADETHHVGPEQEEIEKFNKHQAYVGQPKVADLEALGFTVRVASDDRRQLIAWLIKEGS